ncbi:hypothetical protein AURDEDRAFT_176673 [Auricularia subglabra TFB-10046 SS5]|uniref:Uncharacterized protein n=1 Tax=Auricularia subglabra (strain TFB-10046 / SS5) TaxID=717982 RepID=J0WQU7_AURST|nr:hypothetical protein AURDEDRAFT_176673 [Auricularia subglabra TFB-10046 SS5]
MEPSILKRMARPKSLSAPLLNDNPDNFQPLITCNAATMAKTDVPARHSPYEKAVADILSVLTLLERMMPLATLREIPRTGRYYIQLARSFARELHWYRLYALHNIWFDIYDLYQFFLDHRDPLFQRVTLVNIGKLPNAAIRHTKLVCKPFKKLAGPLPATDIV